MRHGVAAVVVGVMVAGCSRAPEVATKDSVPVRTGAAAAVVVRPPNKPTQRPASSALPRQVERKAFVDPPLPAELVDPAGLAPLPRNPRPQGEEREP